MYLSRTFHLLCWSFKTQVKGAGITVMNEICLDPVCLDHAKKKRESVIDADLYLSIGCRPFVCSQDDIRGESSSEKCINQCSPANTAGSIDRFINKAGKLLASTPSAEVSSRHRTLITLSATSSPGPAEECYLLSEAALSTMRMVRLFTLMGQIS